MKMKKIIIYILIFSISIFVLAALSPSYNLVYSQDSKSASNILASGIIIGAFIICVADFIIDLYVFVLSKIKNKKNSKSSKELEV